jgi:glycosyltransferase involved in cell wall biosynthesis
VLTPQQGEGNVAAALRMLRESKQLSFDVVTAQDPFWSGLIALRVARRAGARLNVQVHSDIDAQSWVKRVLAQVVLRRADSIRVVSARIQKQVVRLGAKAHITVLPVYIDIERFKHIERQPDTTMVLWMGRFEKEKDPFVAIDVIKRVPGARLVMLGTGSLEPELKRRAAGLAVEFPGWRDPAEYLAKAGVVLNTSPAESFGASIVEALAAGVPVVAPDVGIAQEAGAIVVPREKLADSVAEVLKTHPRGELKLQLFTKDKWVTEWLGSF